MLCFSWWEIITHLSWSLLEIDQQFNPLDSVDVASVTLAKLFYATFLFIAVILLVNMLIALLSHTYQRVKVSDYRNVACENSRPFSLPAPSGDLAKRQVGAASEEGWLFSPANENTIF